MALLAWAIKERMFLKIQEGTGDALSWDDVQEGTDSYVLWGKFRVGDLDLDQELNLEEVDGGVLMGRGTRSESEVLSDCFRAAFGRDPQVGELIVLMDDSESSAYG